MVVGCLKIPSRSFGVARATTTPLTAASQRLKIRLSSAAESKGQTTSSEKTTDAVRKAGKKQRRQPRPVVDNINIEDCKAKAAEALGVGRLEDAVLYRDADYIAVNKPWGLSVTEGPKVKDSLQRHLRALASSSSSEVPILIHRSDTATAGVQLLARHKAAATMARDRIGARSFWNRTYWALVWGKVQLGPRQFSGTINIPLIHRGHHVVPASFHTAELSAITKWEILKYSSFAGGITLLKYTGRRDQLQAHCAFGLRTPVVGDDIYSKQAIRWNDATPEKHMLQRKEMFGEDLICKRMISMHSFGGDQIDIIAPVPPHMRQMFDKLGWYIEDDQSTHSDGLWDAIELPEEGRGEVTPVDRSPTYEPYQAGDPLLISSTALNDRVPEEEVAEKSELNFVRRYKKRVSDQQTAMMKARWKLISKFVQGAPSWQRMGRGMNALQEYESGCSYHHIVE